MKTCAMALRLKAHTADAAMLFLNVSKGKTDPTKRDYRREEVKNEKRRNRKKH